MCSKTSPLTGSKGGVPRRFRASAAPFQGVVAGWSRYFKQAVLGAVLARARRCATGFCFLAAAAMAGSAEAGRPPAANVPPTLEIEVLDPNADPQGYPAVELVPSPAGLEVNIPPAVLVHKYYYTGDRSFQAQFLPGGPSIVVANHPKTGERCYIDVQMLPGAPRVTYTGHCIEYDYGDYAITIVFRCLGPPVVHFRSGPTWRQRAADTVHAEQWQRRARAVSSRARSAVRDSHEAVTEMVIDATAVVKDATVPVQQILRVMPLGPAIFDPDRARLRSERIAEHRRETEIRRAEREAMRNDQTIRTIR